MPKVYGYCRLSKEEITATCTACKAEWTLNITDAEQTDFDCPFCQKTHKVSRHDPVSIQAQTDKVKHLNETKVPRNVDPKVRVLVDVNVSGSVPVRDRPKGSVLMAELRDGDYLIAAKLDRLFRDLEDCVRQVKFFRKNGIKLILGDFPDLDINSPVGEMVLQILAVFAEFERKRIAERTRDGLKKRKELFLPIGNNPPRGYSFMCTQCDHIYNYEQGKKGMFCPGCKCGRKGNLKHTPNRAEHRLMWRLLWERSAYFWKEWDHIVHDIDVDGIRTREQKKFTRRRLQEYHEDGLLLLAKGMHGEDGLLEEERPAKMENFTIHKLPHLPKKVAEYLEEKSRKESSPER